MSSTLFADHALLPSGWARDVLLRWDDTGHFNSVAVDATRPPDVTRITGPLLPGLPNLHSHAFQRGFAGLTEFRGDGPDSFWSWRELMYRFAARLTPELMQAIATGLYAEMLAAGYTHVCEFQYVHHQADGTPYAEPDAMCRAVIQAAADTGIGLTLLPVLYQTSGFGSKAPTPGQARFVHSTDDMLQKQERLLPLLQGDAALLPRGSGQLGLAPHSLRAVPLPALRRAVAGMHALHPTAPIHIHIAEQMQEVHDCMAWSGQRPVAWLLDQTPVDARWCLVHATHLDDAEVQRAAASGAIAGLCPSTEMNLGDGLFAFDAWRANGGTWGIGSDSHATVNAAEEIMLLEYGQRLVTQRRNVGATDAQRDTATALLLQAVAGGAQASGLPLGGLAVGHRADMVALDAQHPALSGVPASKQLAAHVFASHRSNAIDGVWVAGRHRVQGGRHVAHDAALNGLLSARQTLLADV